MTEITNINKKVFLVISIFIIISSLVSSQGFLIDYSDEIGLESGTVMGAGIEFKEQTTKDGDSEVTSYRLHFVEEGAIVEIRGDSFKNILRELKSFHPTYIRLDEEGTITNADFTVDENGGNYTFEGKVIRAPPASRVFFDIDIGVKIEIPDNTDFTGFPDLSGLFPDETTIKGKEIQLPDNMKLIDGELKLKDEGYFLEQGTVEYKQMKIDAESVLIANSNADLSNYNEGWIKQTDSILEMQSIEGKSIQVEFLENHEILNTDEKDKLIVNIENGDGLKIEEREEDKLIPQVIHKSSDNGESKIYNDKLEFSFNENELSMSPPGGLEDEDFLNKYQSVAFEMESDSSNIKEKIRVNSYRQFAILSKNNEEIITYNKYGLPVSSNIKDNELQSLEQLREKYPGFSFAIEEDSLFPEDMEESDFPPYMVYYTDEFLESHPDVLENLKGVQYGNWFGSHHSNQQILLERFDIDPTEPDSHDIRDITNPLYVFQHEYEHRLDTIVKNKEFQILRRLNNDEIDKLFVDKWNEDAEIVGNIAKTYYEEYPENGMLYQKYNEIAIEAIEKLDENTHPLLNSLMENDEYVSTLTGIPYAYSLRNYNDEGDVGAARYLELSATYREQSIETRKMNVQSSNPATSEIYTKLTQLAFDSGKMDIEEYKEIMGENYCYDSDCLDKLCSEYKLLCCKEHPNSINC